MKIATIYTSAAAVLLSLGALSAEAQEKAYKGKINISVIELQQVGDSLRVQVEFDAREAFVESKNSIDLIPVLATASKSVELPKVTIKGRNNYNAYHRGVTLLSAAEERLYLFNAPYRVVKSYKAKEDKLVNYKLVIPFESWMTEARLDLKEETCGCNGSKSVLSVERLANNISLEKIITPYEVSPRLAYVQPIAEPIKHRTVESEAFLDFAAGKIVILPEFGNNPAELAKINKMVADVKEDEAITVRRIDIKGYASPEGSLALNKRLSEGRAKALQTYLIPRYSMPQNLYAVAQGDEDWAGLRKMVSESTIEYQAEVLAIIDGTATPDQKEAKLIALKAGAPYRQMLKEMFPSLRRVVLKVSYDVKDFDVNQAVALVKTRPQNLSLNEMYLAANTFQNGSPEFNEVFETAVRMFPDDEVANLNASASALLRKDVPSAERYLAKVKAKNNLPEYVNNRGVLLMLKGEYEKAAELFKAAQASGVDAARLNLEELRQKQENILLLKSKTK